MDTGILSSVRSADGDRRVTHRLLRAARAGLGLTLLDLARQAGLSISAIRRVEDGDVDGPASTKLRRALKAAGAGFIVVDGAPAVRLGIGAGRA